MMSRNLMPWVERAEDRRLACDGGGAAAASVVVDPSEPADLPQRPSGKVAILMCTYQGQRYLTEQLESIACQTHSHWTVWASDDGSTDDTWAMLEERQAEWGRERLSLHRGPRRGLAANFLSLTCKSDIDADYFAYADQDDIWEPEKLQRALQWLNGIPPQVPALYCSRTRLVDANNREIGYSPLFTRRPGFANALTQSIAGGNTMVFNAAARSLLRDAGEDVSIVVHDWWAYLVVSGCGGQVFYDRHPSLRYRQHGGNLIGSNSSCLDRLSHLRMLWQGQYREWGDINIKAIGRLRERLTPENCAILDRFVLARDQGLLSRLISLRKSGVYRQTLYGNLALIAAAIFKRL